MEKKYLEKITEVFKDWENNIYNPSDNSGNYPEATNKVFQFGDYISFLNAETIANMFNLYDETDDADIAEDNALKLKQFILNGLDIWLNDNRFHEKK